MCAVGASVVKSEECRDAEGRRRGSKRGAGPDVSRWEVMHEVEGRECWWRRRRWTGVAGEGGRAMKGKSTAEGRRI